jgi:hypothetical protein
VGVLTLSRRSEVEEDRWFTVTLHTDYVHPRRPAFFMVLRERHGSRAMRLANAIVDTATGKVEGLEELKLKLTPIEEAFLNAVLSFAKVVEYYRGVLAEK